MQEAFDPYRKWLGIAPHHQPPDLYRLLGLVPFEDDADVIQNAADRQMAHVRTFQRGPHQAVSQRILNELAAANVTLLDPAKKEAYDAYLRQRIAQQEASTQRATLAPMPLPVGTPIAPQAVPPPPPSIPAAISPRLSPVPQVGRKRGSVAAKARARRRSSPLPWMLGLFVVGTLVVSVIVFLFLQEDPPVAERTSSPPPANQEQRPAPETPAPEAVPMQPAVESPPEAPKPSPNAAPEAEPMLPADFRAALEEIRKSLGQRRLPQAKQALAQAKSMASDEMEEAEVAHWEALSGYLEEFWRGVRVGALERMEPGDAVVFDGEELELVARDANRVTLRFGGREHTAQIEELQPQWAALFARKGLDTRSAQGLVCLAAFWTLDGPAAGRFHDRARQLWVEAAERGTKDVAVARELQLDEDFIAGVEKSAPLPKIRLGESSEQ